MTADPRGLTPGASTPGALTPGALTPGALTPGASTPGALTPGASTLVVAAVVEREGRYLVGRRPAHKRHGDLWEFPGGKLDAGESMAEAAARELAEELGVHVVAVEETLFEAHDAGSPFVIHFVATRIAGDPKPLEHSEIGWFTPAQLAALDLAPSDARFVQECLVERTAEDA